MCRRPAKENTQTQEADKNNVRSIEGDLVNSLIYEDANDAFSVAVTDRAISGSASI